MDVLVPAMLVTGLASGVHCVGMCGGIITAFSERRTIPIVPAQSRAGPRRLRQLAFNAGRITTYGGAGAIAGSIGAAALAAGALPAQHALQIASSLLLVAIGLNLLGATRLLAPLERLGTPFWAWAQPHAVSLLGGASLARAYAAGLVWGALPCAMVYGALAAAAFAGGPLAGAVAMAAFGLGTLPFLLAAGWLAGRLHAWRALAGALVIGFGAYGLAHAGGLGEQVRRSLLCF